jgi:hypothetical protein
MFRIEDSQKTSGIKQIVTQRAGPSRDLPDRAMLDTAPAGAYKHTSLRTVLAATASERVNPCPFSVRPNSGSFRHLILVSTPRSL